MVAALTGCPILTTSNVNEAVIDKVPVNFHLILVLALLLLFDPESDGITLYHRQVMVAIESGLLSSFVFVGLLLNFSLDRIGWG